jgi:hypothetical protein
MKYHTTKKAIMHNYYVCVSVPYCDLQDVTSILDAESYTDGVYGWNADIYRIDGNTALVTGYRPFGSMHFTDGQISDLNKYAIELRKMWTTGAMTHDDIVKAIRMALQSAVTTQLNQPRK